MIHLPKKSREYPFYILVSWLALWGAYFLMNTFITLTNLTPDGKYVQKADDRPYFVTVGAELKYSFVSSGVIIGFGTIIGGSVLALNKYYKEKKKK
ncbi:MAG: hypothetical protein HY344_02275 [Candidatus Levybacteria bacterium]|nr:hypothetical protein [Candidatus Levybacteria bacterium]